MVDTCMTAKIVSEVNGQHKEGGSSLVTKKWTTHQAVSYGGYQVYLTKPYSRGTPVGMHKWYRCVNIDGYNSV